MEGPIIRINPYEIHIDDPEYADTLSWLERVAVDSL